MPQIIERRLDLAEMPPELAKLLHPLVVRWEAAIVRVAETHSNSSPPTFPSDSIERQLQERFSFLPMDQQATARLRVNRAMRTQGKVGTRASRVLKVNLADLTESVNDAKPQAAGKFQLSAEEKQAVVSFAAQLAQLSTGQAAGDGDSAPDHSTLELRFRRMRCVDETNGFLGSEAGSDEMAIGSTTVDTDGVTTKIERVNLYKNWDDHDDRPYHPPKVIGSVNLQGKTYPLTAYVSMVMVEEDGGGGLETLINRIYDKLAEEVKDWLAGQIPDIDIDILLGLVIAYLVDKIVEKLKSYWDDDPFHPQTLVVTLPTQNSTFNGKSSTPSRYLWFTGPGEYWPVV